MDQGTVNYLRGIGATDDQIQRSYARYQQTPNNNPNPTDVGAQGNWFTHALPTIGGIAGGIATAPLEALDAVTGLGGTALNVAGGAGGSALGKMLENTLEGTKSQGLGQAALEGGIGSGIGKGLGLAGKFATNMLDKTGTNLVGKSMFGAAPKGIQVADKANTTTGNILDYGIKPADLQDAIEKTTYGDNAALNNGVLRAYEGAGPVDMPSINAVAKTLAQNLEVAKPGSGKALLDMHGANMEKLGGQPSAASGGQSAQDVLNTLTNEYAQMLEETHPVNEARRLLAGVRDNGGINTDEGIKTEINGSTPLNARNNTTGMLPDEMASTLANQGHAVSDGGDLLQRIEQAKQTVSAAPKTQADWRDLAETELATNPEYTSAKEELAANPEQQVPATATSFDPSGTYQYMRNLQNAAHVKGLDPNVKNAYLKLATHLDQRLTSAGANDAVVKGAIFTPEDIATLNSVSPKLAQTALSQQTAGGVRSLMAPFAKSKSLLDAADAQGEAIGGAGSEKMLPTAAKAILGNPTGQRVAGTAMRNTAQLLDRLGSSPVGAAVPGAAGQAIAHGPDFTSPQTAIAASTTPPDSATPPIPDLSTGTPNVPTSPNTPGPSGFTDAQLQQMQEADLQTGGQHASTIQGLMKMNQASEKASSPPLSAVTKRMYSQVTSADARLNDFQKLMDRVVNQSGPGALLTGLARSAAGSANLDTDAKNFNEVRSEMALSIARALSGGSTQGSEGMLKRIEGYIPKITDSKESAAQKMQMLHQMMGDTKQAIVSAPDYGSTFNQGSFSADPSQISFSQ